MVHIYIESFAMEVMIKESWLFGSTDTRFERMEGTVHCFDEKNVKEYANENMGKGRLEYLGSEYADLVIPAVPAIDYMIEPNENLITSLPLVLRTPLIKTSASSPLHGVQSGRRSALIYTENRCDINKYEFANFN